MLEETAAAFLSYVHSDDDHDGGRISGLRERLEGEVRMHLGRPFRIFQDRNDLEWGQSWADRIDESLNAVTFLVPIVTPSFFKSPACRKEFETFYQREQALGTNRLILPIYYLDCDEIEENGSDQIATILRSRQWSDWRSLRFFNLHGPEVSAQLAAQALMIKRAIKELDNIFSEGPTASLDILIEQRQAGTENSKIAIENGIISAPEETSQVSIVPERNSDLSKSYVFEYRVFTREFDETIRAESLLTPEESLILGKRAISFAENLSAAHSKTLKDFESDLMEERDVSISILVDNSGSLRGRKISATAAWSILLLEMFDRIGWKTELVGFTTRSWKGGQSREQWLAHDRPPSPGRLADLRYIIYKSFEDSVLGSLVSVGAMLKEGVLKENIDGEALEWASNRIDKMDSSKKIILVLSDGAPVDDSTLSVNPVNYLERHLRQVRDEIIRQDLNVLAVGIEHDVTQYYGKNSIAATGDNLGLKALELLRANLPIKLKRRRKKAVEEDPGLQPSVA